MKGTPLNVGRWTGLWLQHRFINWIISTGTSSGIRSTAGRSPFRTHWHIWSSLLASEYTYDVDYGCLEVAFILKRNLISIMAKTWLVTWTWDCRRIPTHFRMALSQWEWPKQLLQSCRRRTSRWRVCECSPGAQEPCSSACRHLSRKLMAPCGSSCETPPLWVCSTPDM